VCLAGAGSPCTSCDGIGVLPDPYVWYRYQLLLGIPAVAVAIAVGVFVWDELGLAESAALFLLVTVVIVEGLLLRISRGVGEAGRVALGWTVPDGLARPPVFGLLGPRHGLRTVSDTRRALALRGFTEKVLHESSIAQARVVRRGWTVEVHLRTKSGDELALTRSFPVGQRRFLAVLRSALGNKLDL
jgi:hypothetical protein